jgi:type IV pilus assembly protein PilZ
MSDERRGGHRRRIRLEVQYESLEEFLTDFASNMSLGGMFISTSTPLPRGQQFLLRFKLPGRAAPIEATGQVRWVNGEDTSGGEDDDSLRAGMGIHFAGISEEDRMSIARWLEEWAE